MTILKVWRAFWRALGLTLRGEVLEKRPAVYPEWTEWAQFGAQLLHTVFKTAEVVGLNQGQREALKVKIERREMSMETILAAVQYHLTLEYPKLLSAPMEFNLLTISALNIDDVYRLKQLASLENIAQTALNPVIKRLIAHLEAIPKVNESHEPEKS